jgi:hypothetical protein
MSFQNLVRLSEIKKKSPSDYAHVKMSKNEKEVAINDIFDRFTMEHFQCVKE